MGKWGAECLVGRGRGRGYPDTLVGEMLHSTKVTNAILCIFHFLGNCPSSSPSVTVPPRPVPEGRKGQFKRPQDV